MLSLKVSFSHVYSHHSLAVKIVSNFPIEFFIVYSLISFSVEHGYDEVFKFALLVQ